MKKALLWQHSGPLACSDSAQLRVDKYATISHCTNRYSVSEKLVGCFVDVKIFSNTIEAYYENKPVGSHQRDYGKHQWVIDIEHYLDTLRQKPGALNGSVALTCRPYLKKLYQQFYTNAPATLLTCSIIAVSIKSVKKTWKPPYRDWLAFAPKV
jgi:hypothetical protein